jgi:hypothetical protein
LLVTPEVYGDGMTATTGYKSLRELSPAQLIAIDALLAGDTHAQAADKAGVHRVTVSKWVAGHPAVQAELNRRRRELSEARAARLRELDETALDAVAAQLDASDPEFALKWLKLRGLNVTAASGPTDPEAIINAEVSARCERARNAELDHLMDLSRGVDETKVREETERDLAARFGSND